MPEHSSGGSTRPRNVNMQTRTNASTSAYAWSENSVRIAGESSAASANSTLRGDANCATNAALSMPSNPISLPSSADNPDVSPPLACHNKLFSSNRDSQTARILEFLVLVAPPSVAWSEAHGQEALWTRVRLAHGAMQNLHQSVISDCPLPPPHLQKCKRSLLFIIR
eukprot:COSAG02_NODE_11796_length_1652_cov_1.204633_4_plen_167_part_00